MKATGIVRRIDDLRAFDVFGYAFDEARSANDCLVFVQGR